MPFKYIEITGMDTKRTEPDPRSGSALYSVFLNLSATPSAYWTRDFQNAWKEHIYMEKRNAVVIGGQIMITCSLEDWDTVHVPQLSAVMAEVNKREETAENERAAAAARRKEAEAETKRKIEQAASRFNKGN